MTKLFLRYDKAVVKIWQGSRAFKPVANKDFVVFSQFLLKIKSKDI